MSIIFYNIIKRSSSVSLFNVEVVYELYNCHEPMIELSFLNIFYVNRVSFIIFPFPKILSFRLKRYVVCGGLIKDWLATLMRSTKLFVIVQVVSGWF